MGRTPTAPEAIDVERVRSIMALRCPWVLLDRVTAFEAGERLRAERFVEDGAELCQSGPGAPRLPSSLLLEAMQQAAVLLAYASDPFDPAGSQARVLRIDRVKLSSFASAGDLLAVEVTTHGHESNVWTFHVEATVGEVTLAEAHLVATIVDR